MKIYWYFQVHTQHYKYKSAKNREGEIQAAMEATAGAIEDDLELPEGISSAQEEIEKLSNEASEYRSWCKLMELNALKNITSTSSMPPGMDNTMAIGTLANSTGEATTVDASAAGPVSSTGFSERMAEEERGKDNYKEIANNRSKLYQHSGREGLDNTGGKCKPFADVTKKGKPKKLGKNAKKSLVESRIAADRCESHSSGNENS